ncbi:MAG: type II toxin-antitoxin system MqsA family antitoxin [Lysobacteraceae bacterium]|nr:MAG: type II toxin-antitoxin system MqsA family antitoxin [Xanthomonadaceae bacterium]
MGAKPESLSSLASRARSTSSRSTSSSRRCASCGRAGVQLKRVTRPFGSGRTLLVVEGIPMWSCPHCGESYFTAQTMHELERMKTFRKAVAVRKPVAVAEYRQAGA